MKTRNKYTKTTEKKSAGNSASDKNNADAVNFHAERITHKRNTESIRAFANQPTGNDEIEQSIAENVDSTKIAETAFLIAEKRDFVPGYEKSDWLQAETQVEDVLNTDFIDRRNAAIADRRIAATINRRVSAS
ncbi:MAG: DUF2934 domain-containing protein [Propionivibrio sp.]|uniref:DUF2934 domain-containing protein n=1 Tax=Candidatus Propionivibrio dominans TaxID=2954373 RepID=A0A9D7FIG9_9RHOO|nr:DUF2934 domain-containing protein [Candidatus Propionivibrio dominans]MBL0166279.1 DUF2934 domain-containing protein [Propionivibrio sp.]